MEDEANGRMEEEEVQWKSYFFTNFAYEIKIEIYKKPWINYRNELQEIRVRIFG